MADHKRYTKARDGIDPAKAYTISEAITLVKERAASAPAGAPSGEAVVA